MSAYNSRIQQLLRQPIQVKRPFLPGSHIADLAALRKTIILCGFCEPKFNFKLYRYKKEFLGLSHPRTGPMHEHVVGPCDGCKEPTMCQLFMPTKG